MALAEERKQRERAQEQARWERLRQERANRSPLFSKSVPELKASAVAAGLGRYSVVPMCQQVKKWLCFGMYVNAK